MDESTEEIRVLLVEDSEDDERLLRRQFEKAGIAIQLTRVETASAMSQELAAGTWDLIISDYNLPQFDAPRALAVFKEHELDIPFIIVSGTVGEETAVTALKAGAADFVLKGNMTRLIPAVERELAEAKNRSMRRAAEAAASESERRYVSAFQSSPSPMAVLDHNQCFVEVNQSFTSLLGYSREAVVGRRPADLQLWVTATDADVLSSTVARAGHVPGVELALRTRAGEQRVGLLSAVSMELQGNACTLASFLDITERKAAELELQRSHSELEQAYESTLRGWAKALELRDAETEGHSQRVTEMTVRMAVLAGISGDALVHVRRGALLHDIGKMGVPDSILLKPGPLTEAEWAVMREHPTFARDLLSSTDFLAPSLEIPYSHHEKWDGSGYPRGIAGKDIPLSARLFAVVDVWDALASHRPYKEPWPADRIHEHIAKLSGSHFDPAAVEIFHYVMASAAQEAA